MTNDKRIIELRQLEKDLKSYSNQIMESVKVIRDEIAWKEKVEGFKADAKLKLEEFCEEHKITSKLL